MIGLLRKEWREHRGLILGLVLAAPAVSLGVRALCGFDATVSHGYLAFGVPAALAAFAVAVAADLIAADRHRFTAALPVRPSTIWAAKALFLFATSAAFLAWVVGFEATFFAPSFFGPYSKHAWAIVAAPLLGSATLFWSTLIDRGLTAAFAAFFTLAAMAIAALALCARRYGLDDNMSITGPRVAVFVSLAFLAGSFCAFAFGRIHLGSRFRRFVWATSVLLVLLMPAAGTTLLRLERWIHLKPGDPDLATRDYPASPAGDWEFVIATRRGDGPLGVPGGFGGPQALFAVNREDGRMWNLSGYGTPGHPYRDGEAPGRVRLLRLDRVPDSTAFVRLVIDYDLEAGKPVSTRPLSEATR